MKNLFLSVLILLLLTTTLYAEKWQTVGTRSMGMGGVGVATAYGPDAQYYNPALLATDEKENNCVTLNVNAEIETTEKILKIIKQVQDMTGDYQDVIDKITNNKYADAQDVMSIVDTLAILQELDLKNTGALLNANAGISSKVKKLAISVRSYGGAGITPVVDKQNIGLGASGTGIKIDNFSEPTVEANKNTATIIKNALDRYNLTDSVANLFGLSGKTSEELANAIVNMTDSAASNIEQIKEMAEKIEDKLPNISDILNSMLSGGSYKDNESQVIIDAGIFTEVSVGYGYEILEGIQVGGNLKYIQGQMAQTELMILQDDKKIGEKISNTFDNSKTSNQIGLDLGVLLDVNRLLDLDTSLNPKFGITARNINNPFFDRPDRPADLGEKAKWNKDKYYLGSQLRTGVAVTPIKKLIVACDLDLMKNKTLVENFESQELSFGVEYLIVNKTTLVFPVRAGVSKNIATSNSQVEYTFGTGITASGFIFEIAGGMTSSTTKLDGYTIPTSVSCALNLGYAF